MSKDEKTTSIAARKRSNEADAVLDQMFGYFAREDMPRAVISEFDAHKAA
ncbi:hypothetical protein Q4511_16015 [Paracoccus sp. 1_MG-2023]|nr:MULTISPECIES: hypothetical protein [unclassified Paracoccus (in: a-proteobacteria)]MBU2958903.1 hypothetical protein [Paracoccus sp. C2R09]MDO6670423.1 hypothetical protein [Paracoccus sp. 1_MG-2023]